MNTTHDYSTFNPKTYLHEYYATVPPENLDLLRFLVQSFADIAPESLTLDFGGGPTLFTALVAAKRVQQIHYSDFLQANRDEMQKWLNAAPDAFDWGESVRVVLELEGAETTAQDIAARQSLIRQRVTRVLHCDVTQPSPITGAGQDYDVLVSNLCIEAVAKTHELWRQYLRNAASLLKPGGKLLMAAVRGGNAYPVGDVVFHVLPIYEKDLLDALPEAGFVKDSVKIEWAHADHPVHNYEGLLFITATKG